MDLSHVALLTAVVSNGLLAGVFGAFACAVCPALRRSDDRAYVGTFRSVNAAILNGWFLTVFCLAPLAAVAAVITSVASSGGGTWAWPLAGAVCSALTFGITASVNVPLNRALDAAPTGSAAELCTARESYEAPWNRGNLARTVTSTVALCCLSLAAVSSG